LFTLKIRFQVSKFKLAAQLLSPVYTWRTRTGGKLINNRTQYSWPAIFWQHN